MPTATGRGAVMRATRARRGGRWPNLSGFLKGLPQRLSAEFQCLEAGPAMVESGGPERGTSNSSYSLNAAGITICDTSED